MRSANALSSMNAMSNTRTPPSPHAAYRYSPRFCTISTSDFFSGLPTPTEMSRPGCSCDCFNSPPVAACFL